MEKEKLWEESYDLRREKVEKLEKEPEKETTNDDSTIVVSVIGRQDDLDMSIPVVVISVFVQGD